MNKHLFNKKGHGPLYRITAPKFDYTELQNEERMLEEFFENEDKTFQRKKPVQKDQPQDSQKQFTRKQYLIKKMAKTPIKSMGFPQNATPLAINPMLNDSLLRKDPLNLSKSNLFPNAFKSREPMARYAAKNGSIVALGTTGVENENEEISSIEESFFLENSLESTKALMNYDCWDDDFCPEDWVKRCKTIEPPHAKSPIYINKRYIWAGVEIMDWSPETRKFLVKILLNGHEKMVSRLSLMFQNEDHARFMERVQVCKQRQQRAEDEIRFFKYVENKSDDLVSNIDHDTKRNILSKTKKRREEESQITTRLIDGLMAQVEQEYKLFMKKVVVLREMQTANNTDKFKSLRIRMRFIKSEIPFFGTIARFNFPKKEYMDILSKQHISSKRLVVDTMNKITNRTFLYENFRFFKTNLDFKLLPMALANFEALQKKTFLQEKQTLHMQWREYLISEIQDTLRDIYRFYQTESKLYYDSELQRLLKRIDAMFNTYLRQNIVKGNIDHWCDFLQRFTLPEQTHAPESIWKITQMPLLILNLNVNQHKKKRAKNATVATKPVDRKESMQEEEDEILFFEPNYQTVVQTLTKVFEWLVEATNSFTILEKDIVPLVDLKKEPSFQISLDLNWIQEGMVKVIECVRLGFMEPNNILKEFRKYQFLIERTSKEVIKQFFGDSKEKILVDNLDKENIRKSLQTFVQAKDEIVRLCINEKNCYFFQVRTQSCKETLITKANELVQHVLVRIAEICTDNIEIINKTYIEMHEKITLVPKNEEELVLLKSFLDAHKMNLAKLDTRVNNVNAFLDILEEYCFDFSEKTLEGFWELKSWPPGIQEAVLEGTRTAKNQEAKFTENLENSKEKFAKELVGLLEQFETVKKFNNYKNLKDTSTDITAFKDSLDSACKKVESFNKSERLFKQPITEYEELEMLKKDFEPFNHLWFLAMEFDYDKQSWLMGSFLKLTYGPIEKKVEYYFRETLKLQKLFGENEEEDAGNIARALRSDIEKFREDLWLVELLTTEAMIKKPAYWKDVFKEIQLASFEINDDLSFFKLKESGFLKYKEQIEEVTKRVEKQWNIEKKLNEIIEKLKEIKLEVVPEKKSGSFLLGHMDDVQQILDDQLNIVLMLKTSPYIKTPSVQKRANELEAKLLLVQDTLEGWRKCQRSWMYLEPIFSSEDIKKKMQTEKAKFDLVDKHWRATMEVYEKDPMLWDSIDSDKMKLDFESNNKSLDQIQKSLSRYLESKRKFFPRFFFLSDDQLLEILAQTKDPELVQKHINKCFEAINLLQFNEKQEVVGMISPEKEVVPFIKSIDVNEGEKKGNVERWLLDIEAVMRDTLRKIMKDAILDVETPRTQWVLKYQAQIILAVNMIKWTHGAEQAFSDMSSNRNSMKEFLRFLNLQLQDIVELVRGDLKELERLCLGALVVIDVHGRDTINEMVEREVQDMDNFLWLSQLRYYWEESSHTKPSSLKVRMINAEQSYGFEYLGNSPRLVITPLTDRCYRTLMGAYQLYYGGAPEGPAGTGKTESVKDLAKAVAMQCVVFNCSDGLNYRSMSKFFKGLASSGAWCCFDEFNRIDLEVLSVVAQQIITIQNAIKERRKQFSFDDDDEDDEQGKDTALIASCCINITMNPGYAGRSELPDNLKMLFRSCAMMVPDYSMIAEIYLYSVGFQEARGLSRKVVASLRLSSEQLSTQDHYDFGMRALKAILTAAGDLKKKMNDKEDRIVLRALMDVNLPKFTMNDIPLFLSITDDLFPGIERPEINYGRLEEALKEAANEKNLIPEKSFIYKCIQLFDTINVRHGLMLVGMAFSGKSKVIEILARALTILHGTDDFVKAEYYKLNPKSITSFQLYGLFDPDTKSWTDGVLPIIMRECANDADLRERKWVIFDGPVDAIWIENMNTVLDDNKKLCLTTGEIIKLTNWMTMMFEVEDLAVASPATVSRCGMVFLETKNLGWEALLKAFLKKSWPKILEKQTEFCFNNLKFFIEPCVVWVKKFGKFPMTLSDMNLVNNMLNMLDCQIVEFRDEKAKVPKEIDDILNNFFLFCVIWAFGGVLEEVSRPKFHEFLIELITGRNVNDKYRLDLVNWEPRSFPYKLNETKNVFELCYERNKNLWLNWMQLIPAYKIQKNLEFHELIIPTIDLVRNNYFLNMYVKNKYHLLITGPTGTGKTVNIINELNKNYFNEDCTNLCTGFSGQTQANQIQRIIEAKVNTKRKKGYFGPEDRKQFIVIFIDDLNMPAKEKSGCQPPIELLRQWMDNGGWYDLDTKEFKFLCDIAFVSAMGPPSQGRNSITGRYVRHYNILYAEPFEQSSLVRIFNNILEWFFMNGNSNFAKSVTNLQEGIVNSTILLYTTIKNSKELLPTPAKSHYIYNLRDISKVFQGITKASFKSLRDDNDFIKLWAHECMRVFQDRMINEEDLRFFEKILKNIILSKFKRDWNMIVNVEPLLWATFVPTIYPDNDMSKKPLSNLYCELTNHDSLRKTCESFLEEYNNFNSSNRMNLILFLNAIEHIIRIVRILSQPFGHCLLVGVGGSGRKSLTTLSCYICSYDIFLVDQKNWMEELQKVMKMTGLNQRPTVFLVSDTQLYKESMVEDICNILNNGEVPNLFPMEEKAKILEELSSQIPAGTTPNQKYSYFVNKCKEYLHLAICMSPVGEAFRRRLRTFPTLVNCTTIDWFLPWPEEALKATATRTFETIPQLDEKYKEGVVKLCVDMQQRVIELSNRYYQELRRYYYVTPTSYLELLSTFKRLLGARMETIRSLIQGYETGLEKIKKAEEDVNVMKIELNELKPQLQVKTEENQKMLQNLQKEQKKADNDRLICESEERECNMQREKANQMRDDCQKDLDLVLPILNKAVKALENITRDDITKIKSYNIPPKALDYVMQGLCIILGEDGNVKMKPKEPGSLEKIQDFWEHSKKYLLNEKLLKRILNFRDDSIKAIPPGKVVKLKNLINDKEFDQDKIINASSAAANLADWIRACVMTYDALMVVEPKRAKLAEAEDSLQKAEAILDEKKKNLKLVLDVLAELQKEYDLKRKEKEELEFKVNKCQTQLNRASKLIMLLAGELKSWAKKAADYRAESIGVTGDICITSGIIAYMGAFPTNYREECIANWKQMLKDLKIPFSDKFSLQKVLSNEITIANWTNMEKLPNDPFSIDNAIILKNSTRWPLLIDPQMQGNEWIKTMEKQRNLMVLKPTLSANELTMRLENCVSIGVPVLLENIGEIIDPLFESVLQNKKVKQGGSWKLKMGEKLIDYSNDFWFYMTTKLSKPHYTPEICVKVTLLNFVVTPDGLEDQMLNIVVKIEEPIKDEQRQKNIKEFNENKKEQKRNEDRILQLLSETQGNILEDEVLIDALEKSKLSSIEIDEKIQAQEANRELFEHTRKFYKDAAKRVSNLYFVVMELANLEPMYQFSLDSYIQLFRKGIDKTPPGKESRVKNINNTFTALLYDHVVRSLLEKDKLIFSFLMCTSIMEKELGSINSVEVRFLMIGGTATSAKKPNPAPEWISTKQWATIVELSETLPAFKGFDEHFIEDIKKWETIYQSSTPHISQADSEWPARAMANFNCFQRLIILRILRPDKIIPAIQNVIIEVMEPRFIEIPPFEIQKAFEDSDKLSPLVFILSPGADPRIEVINLAEKLGLKNSLATLSLGQGQENAAIKAMDKAMNEGKWVLLQNCHLAVSFMPTLEKLLENLNPEICNKDFRLWLTSMPSPDFPVSILQRGIKMTFEPPKGLKNNLMLSYLQIDHKKFDNDCPNKPGDYKKLLFGLSFFHALVLERRKFGPLGWNIPYQFSSTDLAISISQLKLYLGSYEQIPWEALNYMVAEANYGGRVTDPKDRRLISIILKDFYCNEILSDKYKFSKSGIYYAPPEGTLEDYKEYIRGLPRNDTPEVFGMHDNAEISGAIYETNFLCASILSLLPRTVGGSGGSIEDIIKEKAQNILKRLPKAFEVDEVSKKYPVIYEESMNTVLQQELIRFNKLLNTVSISLNNLIKAIDGLVAMSNELEEVFNKIFDNKVPDLWQKAAYPSLKPLGSWVNDFVDRLEFMRKWITDGAPPSFWISGFYFTQSFLTGTLQNYARKYKLPIDTLGFDFTVLPKSFDFSKQPDDGCYVYGLFLDGARWNEENNTLDEPLPKVLQCQMPHIWLIPKIAAKDDETRRDKYECPVYKTSRRAGTLSTTGHSTNYVLSIMLNIDERIGPEHWVKRGVALLTQLDD